MAGRDVRIVGEYELTVPTYEVLLGVELVAQAFDALPANENELGFAGHLQLPEELRARREDFGRNGGAAPTAELVTDRHRRRAGSAYEVLRLFHELLQRRG